MAADRLEKMAADRLEKTRELLLHTVESLRDPTSSPPPPDPERNSTSPNVSQASGCSKRAGVIGERNRLFNFGFLKKVGTGGGKRASRGSVRHGIPLRGRWWWARS